MLAKISVALTILLLAVAGLFYYGYLGDHIYLKKTAYVKLPYWNTDNHLLAFKTFQQSCLEIKKHRTTDPFSKMPHSGTYADWQKICNAAKQLKTINALSTKQFFETWFVPYQVTNNFNANGLFTGYYLPQLKGSLHHSSVYKIPIYALPKDLVKINLGVFRSKLVGEKIVAQYKNKKFLPYPNRVAIEAGAIHLQTPVLLWAENIIDVFFAQIQGSAIVQLPNHKKVLIGYAGDNGHPYTAIGKVLVQKKILTPKEISMQTIRDWLEKHPEEMKAVLNANASYVFFKKLKNNAPFGSEYIPLTNERSLAVDTRYMPLGAPVWLSTQVPKLDTSHEHDAFHQLMIAQDTGGAIKGIVRGDVYWGPGDEAAFRAGHMKSRGQYWLLLPRESI